MTDKSEGSSIPGKNFNIYDEDFLPLSYHTAVDGRLVGIELEMHFLDRCFVLSVETMDHHMERTASESANEHDTDSQDSDDPQVIVLPSQELLASDLARFKHMSYDELLPYLIEQE